MWTVKVLSLYGEMPSNFFMLLNKRIANIYAQNDIAVATLMFYNDAVLRNIYTACETQVAGPAGRNNCRFISVTSRH